jgi:DNA-directed RNA polymerase subunit N (RpoN/RPB10)
LENGLAVAETVILTGLGLARIKCCRRHLAAVLRQGHGRPE